jgi:ribonuclease HII
MRRSINGLEIYPDAVLVDGSQVPGLHDRCTSIVKGDDKSVSIAAASILAKVVRDSIMVRAHNDYPVYGFDRHKGYPSPVHLKALREHGPCPLHRRSYAPVAQAALDFGIQ